METVSVKTKPTTIAEAILVRAELDDGTEFLRLLSPGEPDRVLAYRELVLEAARWTRFYADAGLAPGERVVVVLPHSVELYAAYLGALLGGLVPAMLNFPSPKFSEEAYFGFVGVVLANTKARLLVAYPELAQQLTERASAALGDARVVGASDLGPVPDGLPTAPGVDPELPAFLQFSSGTTGIKKGVAVSHRALLWQVEAYAAAIGATPADRIVSWLPLYHDMGLITCFFQPLLLRIPVVAMSPFDWVKRPALWLHAVGEHRATLSWLPNFAYSFLATRVRDDELEGVELSSLRGVVNCSEPVRAASHAAFVARFGPYGFGEHALAASYAMAENTFAVTSGGFGDRLLSESSRGGALVSSGRPLPGVEIEIRAPDGSPLPEGEIGEIALRSPSLMTGYDGNPEATAKAFSGGFYVSGDLGYLSHGHLFVSGRKQDLIIVGGRNIYPEDVEAIANDVEGVIPGRAVAFGVPDEELGTENVVVMAESESAGTDDEARLRRALFRAVAERSEVVLSDVQVVAPRTLLKSSAGKLARAANRERYLDLVGERPAQRGEEIAASGVESRVRRIVARLAHEPPADDDATLITSGLIDSFALAELFEELEGAFELTIPTELMEVERFDSVAAIVRTLDEIRSRGLSAARPRADLDATTVPLVYDREEAPRRVLHLRSLLMRARLRARGVTCGPGLRVEGPVVLELLGRPENLVIGRNVTLMPGAHLKTRENGRIVLHSGVKIDSHVRLVAARDARIEIGEKTALGIGMVVNAGNDVVVGRGCLTAPHCVVNASDHGVRAGVPIREQPYDHAPITIGEDVWLGAHVVVSKGSTIGSGAVVSAGSVVSGDVPSNAIVGGRPARVLKFRR